MAYSAHQPDIYCIQFYWSVVTELVCSIYTKDNNNCSIDLFFNAVNRLAIVAVYFSDNFAKLCLISSAYCFCSKRLWH